MKLKIVLLFAMLLSLALCSMDRAEAQTSPRPSTMVGLTYDTPFFPGAKYDPAIPTPDSVLGFAVGFKPANHAQIEAVIKAIAAKSPRTKLFEYGKTHEGRTLYYLVISSESNIKKLDALKADMAKLADPRSVSAAEGDKLADSLPAVAWMAYVIHGDEMSGSDAALAVAHHIAASTGDDVKKLLENLVVIIDPLMNPDGRDRFLKGIAENRTAQPSVDDQSLLHTGVWPSGRMNHYLFDMNRDWIFGSQPETRGRIEAASSWNPHYFMESHEMGSQDAFLFMPPREPINPNIPSNVHKWLPIFGKEQGTAFDRMGWRYYTGEWNEEWYPGYSGSWGGLHGAIENLYEQAAIATDAVRRAEGTLQTYREAVHHQLVSTMANLGTLAANRKQVLHDFVDHRRQNVAAEGTYAKHMYAIVPSANAGRMKAFGDLMALQKFEVHVAANKFTATGRDRLLREVKDKEFPAGTILISTRQPLANMLAAMLDFDPHMTQEFLNVERRELLRVGQSKLYDITAWNITMLYDVEAYELEMELAAGAARYDTPKAAAAPLPNSTVGFVIDGADDRSVALAGRLMERGMWVRAADKAFNFDGREFARGSLVITLVDNRNFDGDLNKSLADAAAEMEMHAIPVQSGMGDGDLPDLGGEHFVLLQQPRIAVVGRDPMEPYSYGETWHLIDHILGLRASFLDGAHLGGVDLRRYNVVVLPEGDAGSLLKEHGAALKDWVQAGGTLIAIGSSASAIAGENGIGTAKLLPDVLDKLDEYRQQIVREWESRTTEVDPNTIWTASPPASLVYPWLIGESGSGDKASPEEMKRRDEWRSIFMPQGAILAARVDDRSWLTAGCGEYLPVLYTGNEVLMAKDRAQAPLRLGMFVKESDERSAMSKQQVAPHDNAVPADDKKDGKDSKPAPGWTLAPPGYELRLRMSGLLWPEAADRLAHSAYLTRERIGNGQVILFASSPTFRAGALGTTRIMANALVYGPGMGANQTIKP